MRFKIIRTLIIAWRSQSRQRMSTMCPKMISSRRIRPCAAFRVVRKSSPASLPDLMEKSVSLLRRLMDLLWTRTWKVCGFLVTNRPGRALIRFYYRYSPPLADFIADRDWLRALVRGLLTPVIAMIEYPGRVALLILSLIAAILVRRRRSATAAARVNGS